MDGYLSKPIHPQELDAVLHEYVERRLAVANSVETGQKRINSTAPFQMYLCFLTLAPYSGDTVFSYEDPCPEPRAPNR
jgi:hypothetical protein